MVGQGMNDFLSFFNECSLKKERSDTAREDHAAFKKLCLSTAIGRGCHFLYVFSSSHKGYMATEMKSVHLFFFPPQPFPITKNEDCDESCLQMNIKHKSIVFSEH